MEGSALRQLAVIGFVVGTAYATIFTIGGGLGAWWVTVPRAERLLWLAITLPLVVFVAAVTPSPAVSSGHKKRLWLGYTLVFSAPAAVFFFWPYVPPVAPAPEPRPAPVEPAPVVHVPDPEEGEATDVEEEPSAPPDRSCADALFKAMPSIRSRLEAMPVELSEKPGPGEEAVDDCYKLIGTVTDTYPESLGFHFDDAQLIRCYSARNDAILAAADFASPEVVEWATEVVVGMREWANARVSVDTGAGSGSGIVEAFLLAAEDGIQAFVLRVGGCVPSANVTPPDLDEFWESQRCGHCSELEVPTRRFRSALEVPGAPTELAGFVGYFLLNRFHEARRSGLEQGNSDSEHLWFGDFMGLDFSGRDLSNADLTRANLGGADLSKATLDGATLNGTGLGQAVLTRASLRNTVVENCIVGGARFDHADLTGTRFEGTDLAGVRAQHLQGCPSRLPDRWKCVDQGSSKALLGPGVDASETSLEDVDLSGADLVGASLRKAQLPRRDLSEALLGHATFDEANLVSAKLDGANLLRTSFRSANLEDASFQGDTFMHLTALDGANLEGVDLSAANVHWVSAKRLQSCPSTPPKATVCMTTDHDELMLVGRGMDMSGLVLANADLAGMDLSIAFLNGADLRGANLRRTNLSGTVLAGANLSDVEGLTPQQLVNACGDDYTKLPAGIPRLRKCVSDELYPR